MNNLLTVQMIVKNEDQWIWYAIASVIDYSSHLLIFDTGSSDRTVEFINTFPKNKITFEEKGNVNPRQMVKLRQEQLERTKTNWFLIVDGDEVWPNKSLKNLLTEIKKADSSKIGIVNRTRICLGDIFHYQEDRAGRYQIGKKVGHFNIRAYKKISDYHWIGIYPNEAYVNSHNIPIQQQEDKLIFLPDYYWHLTNLKRSTLAKNPKRKFELGMAIEKDLVPEVFFKERPKIIPSPFVTYSTPEWLWALMLTYLRKIKRSIYG